MYVLTILFSKFIQIFQKVVYMYVFIDYTIFKIHTDIPNEVYMYVLTIPFSKFIQIFQTKYTCIYVLTLPFSKFIEIFQT